VHGDFAQHREVRETGVQLAERAELVFDGIDLVNDLPRCVLVVPELGRGSLLLEYF
jgi:hypothetical protein